MPCPSVVYHSIGGKPQHQGGGVYTHLPMPTLPSAWRRAFNIYESSWSSDLSPGYGINTRELNRYLDFVEDPNRDRNAQPDTHSAGACEPAFDGPIVLDMERYRPRDYPDVFRSVLERVAAWRPRAALTLYGSVSKWASQWDTPSTAATKQSENDQNNISVYTRHKHVALYLKSVDAAASWEAWNARNVAEAVRWASRTGGRAFAGIGLHDYDGSVLTDAARMLAQVRPAIRAGLDLIVWDYWYNATERDAALPAIAAVETAITTAKAQLWGE